MPILHARRALLLLVGAAAVVALLALASRPHRAGAAPAGPLPPGLGKVAFSSNRTGHFAIYTLTVDGAQRDAAGNDAPTQITNPTGADDVEPAWSPDGSLIAFVRNQPIDDTSGIASGTQGDIWVVGADGSNPHPVSFAPESEQQPAWSPDGRYIAYKRQNAIWVTAADGSARIQLTGKAQAGDPAWSPDQRRIAFASGMDLLRDPHGRPLNQIYSLDVGRCVAKKCDPTKDRAAFTPLTTAPGQGGGACPGTPGAVPSDNRGPRYSPDGARILFSSTRCAAATGKDLFIMSAFNGSHVRDVTDIRHDERQPDWSPDGAGFVFAGTLDRTKATPANENIFLGRIDGSVMRRLTTSVADDLNPDWWSPPHGLPPTVPGAAVLPGVSLGPPLPLRLALRGAALQRPARRHGVVLLRVQCSAACTVTFSTLARLPGKRHRFVQVRGRRVRLAGPGEATVRLRVRADQLSKLAHHRFGPRARRLALQVSARGHSPTAKGSAVAKARVTLAF